AQEISQRLNLDAKRILAEYSLFAGVIDVQHRFAKLVGMFQSQLGTRSRLKITVPSLTSMFLLVRAGYELVESSTRLYRSSILPSSAFRPLGTYPPCSRPVSIAKSI